MPYGHWIAPQIEVVGFLNEKEKEGWSIVSVCPTAGAVYSIVGHKPQTRTALAKPQQRKKAHEEIDADG